jgi:hypothetical protein
MNGGKWVTVLAASVAVILSFCFLTWAGPPDPNVHYPRHYRNWALARSRLIPSTSARRPGFRHHYANDKAARSWGTVAFEQGSVIVDEWLEAIQNAEGTWVEGEVLYVAVMEKDQRYAETGGWGFNRFTGRNEMSGLTLEQARTACFEPCHRGQAARDYVFSDYRK